MKLLQSNDSANPESQRFTCQRLAVLIILLAGVALRWAHLGTMNTLLHYDEAYNAMDALSLIREPRLTPFFPGNFGREAGFIYWAAPFVAILPGNPLAMRLAGTTLGILTLAAATKLGRELLGKPGAIWTLAALSGLYWHVHVSHLAFRANLYVLVGTLAAAWLMRAYRTCRLRDWLIGGVMTGLLVYTYFASLAWLGLMGLSLVLLLALSPTRRRGALAAGVTAVLTMVPMGVYAVAHPDYFSSRPMTVASVGRAQLTQNAGLWVKAWFQAGDPKPTFNLSGRPILDPLQGTLVLLGWVLLVTLVRRRWQALWLIAWAGLALVPSMLSNQAPHFLRALGLTVPVAVMAGAGATIMGRMIAHWSKVRALAALPIIPFLLAGYQTAVDFSAHWLHDTQTTMLMEQPLNEAVDLLQHQTAEDTHIYFSPFTMLHPVIGFRGLELAPRPIGAFDSHQCLVLAEGNVAYFSLPVYEPSFPTKLSQWLTLETVMSDPASPTPYVMLQGQFSRDELPTDSPTYHFGDLLHLQRVAPMSDTVKAGDTLPIILSVGVLQPVTNPLSVFVHLYGDPLPEAGGSLFAQADSQLCATYPIHLWREDESIVQSFDLTLPDDLAPDTYVVAVGAYWFPDGARLPITAPGPASHGTSYVILQEVMVTR